jgi:hypothetical protein
MTYHVTYRKRPVVAGPPFTLKSAVHEAWRLISAGEIDVTIHDGIGNRIAGEALAACCRGEKRLTIDLKAISN